MEPTAGVGVPALRRGPDVVPLELILGFSDTAVVLLPSVRAFPTGLQIEMCLQLHHPGDDEGLFRELDESSPGVDPANVPGDAAWRAGRFTWGVQFADGRRVTNLDPSPYEHRRPAPAEPNHPVLQLNGGDSTQQTASLDYWLWPLPVDGRIIWRSLV